VIKVPTKRKKKRGSENLRRSSSARSETSSVGVTSTESGEVEEGMSERVSVVNDEISELPGGTW